MRGALYFFLEPPVTLSIAHTSVNLQAHSYRMKLFPTITSAIALLGAALLLAQMRAVGIVDGIALWSGVQVYLEGGDPYDFQQLSQKLLASFQSTRISERFVNPPWTLPLLTPLFAWDFATSRFLLILTGLGALWFSISRLQKLWPPLDLPNTPLMWVFFPCVASIYCGQLSFLPLLGVILSLEWISNRGQPWWKWYLAMICMSCKPQGVYLVIPLLCVQFFRRASRRELTSVVVITSLAAALFLNTLSLVPSWLHATTFLYTLRTSTLSTCIRDGAAALGYNSPLTLWILPLVALTVVAARRVKLDTSESLLLATLVSTLTAPYVWVYDYSALLPLFFAVIGTLQYESMSRLRRYSAILLIPLVVIPLYIAFSAPLGSFLLLPITLSLITFILLPPLTNYLRRPCTLEAP